MRGPEVKKSLDTFDLVCLGVNGVIGTGVFILPGIVAASGGALSPLLYLLCGFFCFSIALCFAEMGSAFPRTGGAYVYATEAFGPFIGFLVGWEIWMASLIGWAVVAAGFLKAVDYLYPGVGVSTQGKLIVTGLIIVLSVLNFLGAKMGAWASNVFSVAKVLPLAIFVFMGIPHVNVQGITGAGIPPVKILMLGFLQVLYVFTGFEEMPVPASEVKEPQKTIPRAIFIVLAGVTVFYVLIQVVAQGVFPGIAAFKGGSPLAAAAAKFSGPAGALLLAYGAVVSIAGVNAGIALTGPRSLYCLARDRYMPAPLAKLHPRFGTPYWAIIINTAVVIALTLSGTFESLLYLSALASLLQYIPTCLAVAVLRRTRPGLERGYRVPGGLAVPILGVITCLFLFFQAKIGEIQGTLLLLSMAVPVYLIARKRGGGVQPGG